MSSHFTKELSRFFCRHLVGLSVAYRNKDDSEVNLTPRVTIYSGTIIRIHEVFCFLTAGHALQELETLRASDKVEIVGSALIDTFGKNSISNVPVPFDVRKTEIFYRDSDPLGLDFGVIILDPYYVGLLARNGVVAVSEKSWIGQDKLEFDGYALLGFPQELVSDRTTVQGEISVSPLMFPIDRLPAAPPERHATVYPQFIGQLRPELNLKSVRGMSGGPIFGFRNSDSHYWIVALQSAWSPQKRIIYGCSLPIIGTWLTDNAKLPASAA
jgi:hypothetical protein